MQIILRSKVTTRLLPDTPHQKLISEHKYSSSYMCSDYSSISSRDKIVLSIQDDTIKKRDLISASVDLSNNHNNNNTEISKINRTIAGLQNNQFSSTFHMEVNEHLNDSNVILSNTIGKYDKVNNSSSLIQNITETNIDNNNTNQTHICESSFVDLDNNNLDVYRDDSDDNSSIDDNSDFNSDALDTYDNDISIDTNTFVNVNCEIINNNNNANNNDCINDITKDQKILTKRFSELSFNSKDEMQLDLYHLLKASNAPLILYDRIIDWVKKHNHTMSSFTAETILKREKFLTDLNHRLYHKQIMMKPIVSSLKLSSNRETSVVTFSMKEMILRMVTNTSLFHPGNLLLNPDDPCGDPPTSLYYDEVNSGTWFKDAKRNECKQPNHILMPFCHFIDGLSVDKYGKLTVEAVLTCCLWFNRKARNRSSTWWVQGFIQDQKLFRNQKRYVRDDKVQDYHDMMSRIFKEMKDIYNGGGIKMTLDFGFGRKHEVIAIPVIQYIIGDCKGNDLLCGRKGGHHIQMKGLCRDCNISPAQGDDICLDNKLICSFNELDNIMNQSKSELDKISFLSVRNCFNTMSFGGCKRNIYGATPPEMLHSVLLGLCEYIADSFNLIFTNIPQDLFSSTISGIIQNSKRQSERDIPNLNAFKNGLMSVASLKATERYGRVFCIYIALCNSYLVSELCKRKRKKNQHDNTGTHISRDFLRGYYNVIEDTLLFYAWLKQESFLKSDFEISGNNIDSRAMNRIKQYLFAFKNKIQRNGNGLKTPKFHQMLHIVDYIKRHGCPVNYDGSRGENYGKLKIKDNAQLTNKRKETLNYDIAKRISEEDIVDQISTIYFQNYGNLPSQYCNESDLMINANRLQHHPSNSCNKRSTSSVNRISRPRFILKATFEDTDNENEIRNINVKVDWGGITRTPVLNFPHELLKRIANRLFIGSPHIGGKVDTNSSIPGYTEIVKDEVIYRAHPCYTNKGCWYDWAYFEWEGYENPIPARIMMILDLTDINIIYDIDCDPDNLTHDPDNVTLKHLTNEKWMVVLAAEISQENFATSLSDDHFDSRIGTRLKLHSDSDMWLVPVKCLVGPCFVIYNKKYIVDVTREDMIDDRTAYVIEPMKNWASKFLSPNE